MDKEVTATEAVRDFSGLLNTVKFKGETYIIKRGGKPIASLGPVMEANAPKTMKELKGILNELPRMGDDLDSFEKDMIEVWKGQPSLPEREPWE